MENPNGLDELSKNFGLSHNGSYIELTDKVTKKTFVVIPKSKYNIVLSGYRTMFWVVLFSLSYKILMFLTRTFGV